MSTETNVVENKENKVEKVKKEPAMTEVITAAPEGILEKFKGRTKKIAALLLEGYPKNKVLAILKEEEAEVLEKGGDLEYKPIKPQTIFPVWKRLKGTEGVEIGLVELEQNKREVKVKEDADTDAGVVAEGTEEDLDALNEDLGEGAEEEEEVDEVL